MRNLLLTRKRVSPLKRRAGYSFWYQGKSKTRITFRSIRATGVDANHATKDQTPIELCLVFTLIHAQHKSRACMIHDR